MGERAPARCSARPKRRSRVPPPARQPPGHRPRRSLRRVTRLHGVAELRREMLADVADAALRIDVPHVRALGLLARVSIGDGSAAEPARQLGAPDTGSMPRSTWGGMTDGGQVGGRGAGPGLDQRDRDVLSQAVTIVCAIPGLGRRGWAAGDGTAPTARSRRSAGPEQAEGVAIARSRTKTASPYRCTSRHARRHRAPPPAGW